MSYYVRFCIVYVLGCVPFIRGDCFVCFFALCHLPNVGWYLMCTFSLLLDFHVESRLCAIVPGVTHSGLPPQPPPSLPGISFHGNFDNSLFSFFLVFCV